MCREFASLQYPRLLTRFHFKFTLFLLVLFRIHSLSHTKKLPIFPVSCYNVRVLLTSLFLPLIQNNARELSNQQWTLVTGNPVNASFTFLTRLTAIWPAISSNRGIVSPRLDNLDLDAARICCICWTTAYTQVASPFPLASPKECMNYHAKPDIGISTCGGSSLSRWFHTWPRAYGNSASQAFFLSHAVR